MSAINVRVSRRFQVRLEEAENAGVVPLQFRTLSRGAVKGEPDHGQAPPRLLEALAEPGAMWRSAASAA
jgi:hypothetical protein